jgi:hypothetical protein
MLVVTGDDPQFLDTYGKNLDLELILLWPEVHNRIPVHPRETIARVMRAVSEGTEAMITMSSVAIGTVLSLVRSGTLSTEQVDMRFVGPARDTLVAIDDDGDFIDPWPEPGYSIWEADLQLAIHGVPSPEELR